MWPRRVTEDAVRPSSRPGDAGQFWELVSPPAVACGAGGAAVASRSRSAADSGQTAERCTGDHLTRQLGVIMGQNSSA